LLVFWIVAVCLASLYQALNPTSAHNVGVRIDPLAAVMDEVAFQICTFSLLKRAKGMERRRERKVQRREDSG
ncbi:hypothetical protein KCU79_g131, partial [Aureobasidium melanogenum]